MHSYSTEYLKVITKKPSHRGCICVVPVCVELMCMVEQVEFSNVTEGSRLNGFLLDKQQMFSCILFNNVLKQNLKKIK